MWLRVFLPVPDGFCYISSGGPGGVFSYKISTYHLEAIANGKVQNSHRALLAFQSVSTQ